ncbi:MAG: SDR family NAD(P)-dependent oxidoreductase [Candidatus Bathyarchaeota archaeon]|nr:MAG: SDR family NAD(P)-dependent oxidoreductase [Candidatus Bathyarchaeota archaeon]
MQKLKALVTGGAGFIGSHLVDRLIKERHDVVVLDNLYAGRTENLQSHFDKPGFHLIKGDVRTRKDIKEAVRGVDIIFHLAAIVNIPLSIGDPLLTNDVNVRGTLNLLKASAKMNAQRFLFVSTCAVYGETAHLPIDECSPIKPTSPYGISKFSAEKHCQIFHDIHGLETICLRLFNVYGPRQPVGPYGGVITQFIDNLRHGKPPVIHGTGRQTRDFVYVEDVLEACMLILRQRDWEGQTFNIGAGKPTTINKLAELIIGLYGKTEMKPEHRPPRVGDIQHSYADIKRAERAFGYKPKTGLEEGIRKMLQDYNPKM